MRGLWSGRLVERVSYVGLASEIRPVLLGLRIHSFIFEIYIRWI